MNKVLGVLGIAFLTGCSNLQKADIVKTEVYQPYPSNLTVVCEEYSLYTSKDIKEIILTHSDNMEKAITCKDRHNKLVELIKERYK